MADVRWVYALPAGPAELERRAAVDRRIGAWWAAFRDKVGALEALFDEREDWDLPAWMEASLQAIEPDLMWEFGPAVQGSGHRLVITPEQRRDLRPLVERILAAAPRIDGWEFHAHRPGEPLEVARAKVQARSGRASTLTGASISRGESHLLDLTFTGPDVASEGDTESQNEAFVLSEALLGERVLDCWIGEIAVRPPPKRGLLRRLTGSTRAPELVALDDLRITVDGSIDEVERSLPAQPFLELLDTIDSWSLLELKPEPADEYADQTDLFVAKTPNVELWRATRTPTFYSQRFSRCGEIFCYLKLDGAEGIDQEKFADKGEIEDALDALLIPAGWGCQIGGGTGLRYSYIELALRDTVQALPAIRKLLADGNVSRRSWILFHDCEHGGEWIGIHDDTPAPPRTD
jgi:hypothetical protein